jgi:hypothetical protein
MLHRLPRIAAVLSIAVLAAAAALFPGHAAAGDAQQCFTAAAVKHKTSLGVHQWTVRLVAEWCVVERRGRARIVSVDRDTTIRTGTNWRLVSRSGAIELEGARRATVESRFHFRLRYPYFEQNCYPRLALHLLPDGEFERSVRTGC